jgi:hypothetical protein
VLLEPRGIDVEVTGRLPSTGVAMAGTMVPISRATTVTARPTRRRCTGFIGLTPWDSHRRVRAARIAGSSTPATPIGPRPYLGSNRGVPDGLYRQKGPGASMGRATHR